MIYTLQFLSFVITIKSSYAYIYEFSFTVFLTSCFNQIHLSVRMPKQIEYA